MGTGELGVKWSGSSKLVKLRGIERKEESGMTVFSENGMQSTRETRGLEEAEAGI